MGTVQDELIVDIQKCSVLAKHIKITILLIGDMVNACVSTSASITVAPSYRSIAKYFNCPSSNVVGFTTVFFSAGSFSQMQL